MSKRKLPKVKVSKETGNTAIKIVGLGIVSYFAFKMLSGNSETGYFGGSSSGYSGSGTDLSGLESFFAETPPVFNISNTPPENFFYSVDTSKVIDDYNKTTENLTKKEFSVARTPNETIVGNTSNSLLTNILNPNYWFGSVGEILPENEYKLRSDNYSQFSILKGNNPVTNILANAWNSPTNPLKIFNIPSVAGGCSSGTCPNSSDTDFNISLTPATKKEITSYNPDNFISAQSFLTTLRNEGISPTTVNYTKKAYDVYSSVDNANKTLSYATEIQNKLATGLASNNCSPAIATNACSGSKKSINYANTVSSGVRYYENTIANTPSHLISVEMSR